MRVFVVCALSLPLLACLLTTAPAPTPTADVDAVTEAAIVRNPPTRTPLASVPQLPAGQTATPIEIISADVQTSGITGSTQQARVAANLSNPDCALPSGWTTYTVQRGDSLFAIAQEYDSDVDTMQQANCLVDPRYIEVGQVLAVPGDGAPVQIVRSEVVSTAPTVDTGSRILAAPETVDIYLVLDVPDGRVGGIPAGCGNMLVPIPTTVYGADTPANRVKAALESLFAISERSVDDYSNPLVSSDVVVGSVQIDTGVATVALSGEMTFAGVCEIPLLRGQIEQTVLDDSAVNQAIITINGQSIDAFFSQR
ncbi:MAG: LysM peptidoglycan-binding domain-containing protein [Chloroflexota bacterium]